MSNSEFTYRTAAEETWRIFRIMAEFVEAIEMLAGIGPAVSVFGSARTPAESPNYQSAERLAEALGRKGYAIITGGGPGIMEAANKGAAAAGAKSVGLNISLPQEQVPNRFQTMSLSFDHFFIRKVMFIKYSVGLVCYPGGFGTMDEFYESMTLIQTGKCRRFPVALVDTGFWKPHVAWMKGIMLEKHGNISPQDLNQFVVTDDPDEAVEHIVTGFERDRSILGTPGASAEAGTAPAWRMTAEGTLFGVPARTPPE